MTFARSTRFPLARGALIAGSVSGAIAVMLGAFGAHALRGRLDPAALAVWHTAVDYQFWHALALIAVGTLARIRTSVALRIAAISFGAGSVLFCLSLYALAMGAPHWTGAITPIGGLAFIVGWLALAVHAWRQAD